MEKVTIEINNLSHGQARAIEEYFAVWKFLNEKNMSMWCSFFVDCQGKFIPTVKVNGQSPRRFMKDIGLRVGKVKFVSEKGEEEDDMYLLDYERVEKALAEGPEESSDRE
jgi:hypothetical protein